MFQTGDLRSDVLCVQLHRRLADLLCVVFDERPGANPGVPIHRAIDGVLASHSETMETSDTVQLIGMFRS